MKEKRFNYWPGIAAAIVLTAVLALATSMDTLTLTSFGTLTCTTNDGQMKMTAGGILQWCDDTPTLRHAALGDSSGNASAIADNSVALGTKTTGNYALGDAEGGAATTGDSATAFFAAGQIEAARGGTGIDTSGSTGTLIVTAGTWSANTSTGTGDSVRGTSPTIATPNLTGKIDFNNVAVDDDDCTGEQGKGWYDTTDSQYEFCNANSGTPIAFGAGGAAGSFLDLSDTPASYSGQGEKLVAVNVGETALEFIDPPAGSGDVTDVWGCTSGNCNALTAAAGDTIDAGSADSTNPNKEGTSPPGTCNVGETFVDTDATATAQFLVCTATNTWTAQGGGGGGGGILVVATGTNNIQSNVTRYLMIGGGFGATFDASQTLRRVFSPVAGVYSDLHCRHQASALGGSETITVTVANGGGTDLGAPSAMSCQMTSATNPCTDATNTVTVSAGDILVFKVVTTTIASPNGPLHCGIKFTPS